jgi:hypothetical protein
MICGLNSSQGNLNFLEQIMGILFYFSAFGVTKPRTIAYKPPDPRQLKKYRENRLKELKMYSIIKEIVSYALFVWILLSVSYSFRDPDSYKLKQQMVRTFIKGHGYDYRKVSRRWESLPKHLFLIIKYP